MSRPKRYFVSRFAIERLKGLNFGRKTLRMEDWRSVRVCASRHCKPTSRTTSPDAPEWLERVAASAVDV